MKEIKPILYGVGIFFVIVVGYFALSAIGAHHQNVYATSVLGEENRVLRAEVPRIRDESKVLQDALKGCIVQMYRSSDEDLKVYLEKNLGIVVKKKNSGRTESLEMGKIPEGVKLRRGGK